METRRVRTPDPWEQENQPPQEEQPQREEGSALLGFLGAFLGACVGAIPWFLVSTFTNFYVGWLGFLVAWASVFGYQKLKGRKSYGFAMVAVVGSSLIALVLAEFGGWMFMLCTDPGWQADAARWRVPVARLAFDSLMMPENWHIILPNLGIGLLIGGLGIFSARKNVRQYTDPEKAAEMAQRVQMLQNPLTTFESTGLELPQQFTVEMGKGRKVLAMIMMVILPLMAAFLLLIVVAMWVTGEPVGAVVMLILALVLVALLILILVQMRRRIYVEGDRLRVKGREIRAEEIANVSMSQFNGSIKLYGQDGKPVAVFNNTMKNAPLMLQWLREHNIPLRG